MIITLNNIQDKVSLGYSVIEKRLVRGTNSKPNYQLLRELHIQLSNGDTILIPKYFIWDLSSVPRIFWSFLAPSGDFDLAYLIHDYLWIHKDRFSYTQKFTDDEMLRWADILNGDTWRKRLDNRIRYYGVRALGWLVWNEYIKIIKQK